MHQERIKLNDYKIINLNKECAGIRFIPDLKVGVFVTLRTPDVIALASAKKSRKPE
jgi:hypothetical protein